VSTSATFNLAGCWTKFIVITDKAGRFSALLPFFVFLDICVHLSFINNKATVAVLLLLLRWPVVVFFLLFLVDLLKIKLNEIKSKVDVV